MEYLHCTRYVNNLETITNIQVRMRAKVTGKCYTIVYSGLEHLRVLGSFRNWEPILCARQRDGCTWSEEEMKSILSKHAYSCFKSIYWKDLLLFTTGMGASMSNILFLGLCSIPWISLSNFLTFWSWYCSLIVLKKSYNMESLLCSLPRTL